MQSVKTINDEFRQKYGTVTGMTAIRDLVSGLQETDFQHETGQDVLGVDPAADEPRTLTLRQFEELFNALLKRSGVNTRLTETEAETKVLKEKVAALEDWKTELEERLYARNEEVDNRIAKEENRLDVFKGEAKVNFNRFEKYNAVQDSRYQEIKAIFKSNHEDRLQIHKRVDTLDKRVTDTSDKINEKMDQNYARLWNFTEEVEQHMNVTLETQRKTIQNVKFELVEILDNKHENMQKQFDQELSTVKQKYKDAVEQVEESTRNLKKLFKEKVKTIKEKSALFFAKVELKLKDQNADVLQMSQLFRQFQETLQGPTQKFDARICSIRNEVTYAEREREAEFGMLKDVVTRLVYALEDKVSNESITKQDPQPIDLGQLALNLAVRENTFGGTNLAKRKQS